ncbi:MAG: cation:proton antiporter subunit C [Erysipelotrichia bacterium]|jgi:multicomponent Na+:H+ antiporter subunit C|nr:cation:proton antiporter subunit C [Erysipelotrichia bacterium]MBS3971961.1 cation:proton antiporter subunit C [Erysipelotrichia bacterium]
MIESILTHMNYIGAMALFVIGLHTVLTHSNLVKRIIGLNIMETSVFLFFVSIGSISGGVSPIFTSETSTGFINPIPSALILTGIVVAVSISAYSLSLIIKIYEFTKSCELKEFMEDPS